jgi:hypothetical protein
MTRHTRRVIFYILVALFVIVGAAVVLYADGWRINPANFQTEKVGGIYVRSFPQNASITLDGKPIPNQSNFLNHGTLISNLFPKNYVIGLSLAGYDGWQENADVTPSLVVEMKYAVLVPQDGTAVATSSDVQNFFASNGELVDQHTNGAITWRRVTVGNGTIMSHSSNLKNMIYRDVAGNYELYDFTTQKTTNLSNILQKQGANPTQLGSIIIDPYNDTSAIAVTSARVWTINLNTQAAQSLTSASSGRAFAPVVAASQSSLAWSMFGTASSTSVISVYDKFSGLMVAHSPALSGNTQGIQWINGDTLGVLQNNGSLSLYTLSSNTIRPLASDVKAFYPTADGLLVAALEKNSLEVFDFGSSNYYRFNLPDMGSVQNLAWYKDENHLFVTYPDHVAFFDLADTSLMNVTTVSQGTSPLYNSQNNALYMTNTAGNVVRFNFSS